MFELTNEQRVCFGLATVEPHWTRMEPKPSPYDGWTTIAYLDGTVIRKIIETGNSVYTEHELCEQLSDDLRYLLPKTAKGKPVLLSAATLKKRTGTGMCLSYTRHQFGSTYIALYSHISHKGYYANDYEPLRTEGIQDFQEWVEQWCAETTPEDIAEITCFAVQPRQHQKFKEGDVFRFKINRRLYGYGRILLDYALMRKKNVPFWDILAGKPLVCSAYHIVTERKDVSIAELQSLPSLPSVHMMDNHLFYGDFEIIGHIPVTESEDYPIMYGGSIDARYRATLLQCGRLYRRDDDARPLFNHCRNSAIGFDLRFRLPVLLECIEAGSNAPYWAQDNHHVNNDLRNPIHRATLEQVCAQFGLSPDQLLKTLQIQRRY